MVKKKENLNPVLTIVGCYITIYYILTVIMVFWIHVLIETFSRPHKHQNKYFLVSTDHYLFGDC